jgi:hypothetical protein
MIGMVTSTPRRMVVIRHKPESKRSDGKLPKVNERASTPKRLINTLRQQAANFDTILEDVKAKGHRASLTGPKLAIQPGLNPAFMEVCPN